MHEFWEGREIGAHSFRSQHCSGPRGPPGALRPETDKSRHQFPSSLSWFLLVLSPEDTRLWSCHTACLVVLCHVEVTVTAEHQSARSKTHTHRNRATPSPHIVTIHLGKASLDQGTLPFLFTGVLCSSRHRCTAQRLHCLHPSWLAGEGVPFVGSVLRLARAEAGRDDSCVVWEVVLSSPEKSCSISTTNHF